MVFVANATENLSSGRYLLCMNSLSRRHSASWWNSNNLLMVIRVRTCWKVIMMKNYDTGGHNALTHQDILLSYRILSFIGLHHFSCMSFNPTYPCHVFAFNQANTCTSVLKKLFPVSWCVWKRAICFLPHAIISFRQKKKVHQKYQNFIRGDPYKLGQTPLNQKKFQKSNIILEGSRYPNFMNPFK